MNTMNYLIKRLRAEPQRLTQTEIAKRIGTTQALVSRWELGDVSTSALIALRLVSLERELSQGAQQ